MHVKEEIAQQAGGLAAADIAAVDVLVKELHGALGIGVDDVLAVDVVGEVDLGVDDGVEFVVGRFDPGFELGVDLSAEVRVKGFVGVEHVAFSVQALKDVVSPAPVPLHLQWDDARGRGGDIGDLEPDEELWPPVARLYKHFYCDGV